MTEKIDRLDCINICQDLNIKIVLLLISSKVAKVKKEDNTQYWYSCSEMAL